MVNCGHVYVLKLLIAQKEKIVVPAYIEADGKVRFFVVNTERTKFQTIRPEVAKHVLFLPYKGNDKFLTHDSWLACHEVVGGWKVDEIDAVNNCYRGPLDATTVAAVRTVIQDSRLHSERDKAAILKQWPG